MIKKCNFFLVPAMNTDRESGGTAPPILNVGNCDTMIVSEKMEKKYRKKIRGVVYVQPKCVYEDIN